MNEAVAGAAPAAAAGATTTSEGQPTHDAHAHHDGHAHAIEPPGAPSAVSVDSVGFRRKRKPAAAEDETPTAGQPTGASVGARPTAAGSSSVAGRLDGEAAAAGRVGGDRDAKRGRTANTNRQPTDSDTIGTTSTGDRSSVLPVALLSSPLHRSFSSFASYLDRRNDRRELVFQSSRNLTRASKKLISHLQRATATPSESDERRDMLATAKEKDLRQLHRMVADTVKDFAPDDFQRFSSAYSPGFQEFVESASLLHYLQVRSPRHTARRDA